MMQYKTRLICTKTLLGMGYALVSLMREKYKLTIWGKF